MNLFTPQQVGTFFDFLKAIAGAFMALGLLKITNEQLNLYVTQGSAIALAVLGLIGFIVPLVRSIYVRTRAGSLALAASNLKPGEKIQLNSTAEAAKLPANVVGPAG